MILGFHCSCCHLHGCYPLKLLQIPNQNSAISLPWWQRFASMETVTSWGCVTNERFQVMKKQQGSNTYLRHGSCLFFHACSETNRNCHCQRNNPFWIKKAYMVLCACCLSANSATGQDPFFFFFKPAAREEQETVSAVIDSRWKAVVTGNQSSVAVEGT